MAGAECICTKSECCTTSQQPTTRADTSNNANIGAPPRRRGGAIGHLVIPCCCCPVIYQAEFGIFTSPGSAGRIQSYHRPSTNHAPAAPPSLPRPRCPAPAGQSWGEASPYFPPSWAGRPRAWPGRGTPHSDTINNTTIQTSASHQAAGNIYFVLYICKYCCLSLLIFFHFPAQRWRQLRGDAGDQGHAVPHRAGGVEAAGHLPLLLRDGRGVLPLRRADLRHEVRQLDLRRLPGEEENWDKSVVFVYTAQVKLNSSRIKPPD